MLGDETGKETLATLGPKVLVTDFDGTMTLVDFFDVVLNHIPAGSIPDYWGECEAGRITHVEALNAIFQYAPHDITTLRSYLPETRLDPQASAAIHKLRQGGWDLLVVSAGCQWYIDELLRPVQPLPRIIANPGNVAENGLWMGWPPETSLWYSAHFGVDKSRIIQFLVDSGRDVAFAGDGRPDLVAMEFIGDGRRYAKGWLAEQLDQSGRTSIPFHNWSEIVTDLLTRSSG